MKHLMVLAAMLVMMLVAAAQAFAQPLVYNSAVGVQFGHHNVQSVQNAVNQQAYVAQYNVTGDNVNIQSISQRSNINTGVIVFIN